MNASVQIHFLPDDKIVNASQEESVLEAGLRAGVNIPTSCGGSGTCGTCTVRITSGLEFLPPRNEVEMEMAIDRKFSDEERLSCQIFPVQGLVIEVPDENF